MDVRSLRIGHYLLDADDKVCRVTLLSDADIGYQIKAKAINSVATKEPFKPLPLNIDLIIESGFGVAKDSYGGWLSPHRNNRSVRITQEDDYFLMNSAKVKYMHEFQNIVFALTGFETKPLSLTITSDDLKDNADYWKERYANLNHHNNKVESALRGFVRSRHISKEWEAWWEQDELEEVITSSSSGNFITEKWSEWYHNWTAPKVRYRYFQCPKCKNKIFTTNGGTPNVLCKNHRLEVDNVEGVLFSVEITEKIYNSIKK